jgi:WD40 repeat protein
VSLALNPDGKVLASGDSHGKIYLWELESGERISTIQLNEHPGPLLFSADGARLITTGQQNQTKNQMPVPRGTITVWNTTGPKPVVQYSHLLTAAHTMAVSPKQALLAIGTMDGNVLVLDYETGLQTELFHISPLGKAIGGVGFVPCIAFSHSGDQLAAVVDDGGKRRVKIWRVPVTAQGPGQ